MLFVVSGCAMCDARCEVGVCGRGVVHICEVYGCWRCIYVCLCGLCICVGCIVVVGVDVDAG